MNFGLMSTSGACKDIVVVIYLLKDLSPASGNSSQLTLLGENPARKTMLNKLRNCENITTWRWRRRGRSVLGRFPAEPEQRSSRPGQDFEAPLLWGNILDKKYHVMLILSWKSLIDPETLQVT